MRIAIVSREVAPFVGGGIAPYVTALARALAPVAEVTILTSDLYEERLAELRAQGHPSLPPASVRIAFVHDPLPDEVGPHYSELHAYSTNVYRRLKELFPGGGPDVVEFSDYLGEGGVTMQAVKTLDPALRNATAVVKLHTTAEVVHVLNGWSSDDTATRAIYDLERYAMRHAHRLLFGGGDVHRTYERFYGADRLAPGMVVRQPVLTEAAPAGPLSSAVVAGEAPLRVLYLGRFERRKGVLELLRGLTASESDRWRLTLVGGDTATGALGTSVRGAAELMAHGDDRIEVRGRVDPLEVPGLFQEHEAVIAPSLWECWPNVGLEALRANRPLLATPVGGLSEMAGGGDDDPATHAGRLARDTSADALRELVESAADTAEDLAVAVGAGAPAARYAALTDEEQTVAAYAELAELRTAPTRRRGAARREPPLVSIVIPYFRLDRYVGETVDSMLAQTHPALEVIVVNDGSLREEDRVLDELAGRLPITVVTQANSGLSAARNFGVGVARGRYVLPFDADDLLDPSFVARCVAVLEAQPDVAYVTSWSRFMDEDGTDFPFGGYHPLGNEASLLERQNVAGSALAVFRRHLFDTIRYEVDMTSYEDWALYRELLAAGHVGHVIPEPLIRYRIRAQSMLRATGERSYERHLQEMNAHLRRRQVQWTATPTS